MQNNQLLRTVCIRFLKVVIAMPVNRTLRKSRICLLLIDPKKIYFIEMNVVNN